MTYFEKRQKLLDLKAGQNLKELHAQYNAAYKKIRVEAELLYLQIQNNGATANSYYRFNKYFDLMNTIDKEVQKLGSSTININNAHFEDLYKQTFSMVRDEIAFKGQLNPLKVNNTLNSIWCPDGLHWSSRVWNSVNKMEQTLKDGISTSLITGKSSQELVKEIRDEFGVEFYKADRIVRTEMSVIQNKSTLDTYEEAGVKYYRVLSDQADDDTCGDLDGEEIPISDAVIGETMPPFHPNCRCSITAVI